MNKLILLVSILLIASQIDAWRLMRRPFWSIRTSSNPYRGYFYQSMRVKRMLDSNGLVECIYVGRHSFLNCNRGEIKCEAKLNFNDLNLKFDILGIELATNSDLRLYPKSFKDNKFTSYKLDSASSARNVSLTMNTAGLNGIIISDASCYSKMLNLFQSVNKTTLINDVRFSETKLDLIGLIVMI